MFKDKVFSSEVGNNQNGATPLLILVAVIGLILFLFITNIFSFRGFFSNLFPKKGSEAAGVVDLSLLPSQVTVNPGDTFTVDISMDTKTASVSAAEVHLTYDALTLQATGITKGTVLPVALSPLAPAPFTDAIASSGKVDFTLGANPGTPATGKVSIASITFKALKATSGVPTAVVFDPTTAVAAIDTVGDAKGLTNSSNVIVASTVVAPKTAVFSLQPATATVLGNNTNTVAVNVMAMSDTDAANLFAAKLNFDATKLQVDHIDTAGGATFVQLWAVKSFDNSIGAVTLWGGVPSSSAVKTSGTPLYMATVYFKGVAAGVGNVSFDGTSAIYRDPDSADVLITPTSTSAITVSSTPVATPTPTPIPPTPTPTPIPTTPAATNVPVATPTPLVLATPTPIPVATACAITSVSWNVASLDVRDGDPAGVTVTSSGDCTGKSVVVTVLSDDPILSPTISVARQIGTLALINNSASATWAAEYHPDGWFGLADPPEYYLTAIVVGDTNTVTSNKSNELKVAKLVAGTFRKGDFNHNGSVDAQDLSIMLSRYGADKAVQALDFPAEIDLAPSVTQDGQVNALDWDALLSLLVI